MKQKLLKLGSVKGSVAQIGIFHRNLPKHRAVQFRPQPLAAEEAAAGKIRVGQAAVGKVAVCKCNIRKACSAEVAAGKGAAFQNAASNLQLRHGFSLGGAVPQQDFLDGTLLLNAAPRERQKILCGLRLRRELGRLDFHGRVVPF